MEARLTGISREEALRYMGVRGRPDEALARDVERCAEKLTAAARPRAVWKLFRLEEDGTLQGTSFHPQGEDIRQLLAGGDQVILMAATLGAEAESLIRRAQGTSMSDAVILDALASAAIENVCDNYCTDLAREVAPRMLTPRFSPGYGDFPLSQQRELCAVLNVTRLLGITLTPGGLMIPQKSVTALMGVADHPPAGVSGCGKCPLAERCLYRKENSTCRPQGGGRAAGEIK